MINGRGTKHMFHQNQKLIAPQEYFHFSNRFAKEKLVAHSGFITDTHAETAQFSSEPISFGYWFWHGGFMVAISYLIIVLGTGVFIKHIFSLLKKT